jgi:hypothetical protein
MFQTTLAAVFTTLEGQLTFGKVVVKADVELESFL